MAIFSREILVGWKATGFKTDRGCHRTRPPSPPPGVGVKSLPGHPFFWSFLKLKWVSKWVSAVHPVDDANHQISFKPGSGLCPPSALLPPPPGQPAGRPLPTPDPTLCGVHPKAKRPHLSGDPPWSLSTACLVATEVGLGVYGPRQGCNAEEWVGGRARKRNADHRWKKCQLCVPHYGDNLILEATFFFRRFARCRDADLA